MAQQENRDHTLARHPEGLFGYLMPRSGPVIEPGVCPDLPGEVLILGIRVVEEFKREAFTVEISLREQYPGTPSAERCHFRPPTPCVIIIGLP